MRAGSSICSRQVPQRKTQRCALPSFTNGWAKEGGAIYADDKHFLNNLTFANNGALNFGGAIKEKLTVQARDCTFIGNYAKNGGAMDSGSNGVDSLIMNCRSYNNTASQFGGALYASTFGVTPAPSAESWPNWTETSQR